MKTLIIILLILLYFLPMFRIIYLIKRDNKLGLTPSKSNWVITDKQLIYATFITFCPGMNLSFLIDKAKFWKRFGNCFKRVVFGVK